MERRRWIVVGTDFSNGAAHALDVAVSLAAMVGASVACVHAYEDAPGTPLRDNQASTVRAQLNDAIAASGGTAKGVHVEAFARRGAAWEKLLNVACELGAELIVVGASGERQAPRHLFLGTVATRIAALSTRLVLVVPERADIPHGFEERKGAA